MPAPKVLFVHNNFPGQFGFLAEALVARGWTCAAIASKSGRALPGVPVGHYLPRRGSSATVHPSAVRAEADLIRGQAAAKAALEFKRHGFEPDLVIGHPGWGEMVYMKAIFPRAKQIAYGEFFYRAQGADVGFDREFERRAASERRLHVHAKNAVMGLSLLDADAIVAPTPFQASLLPPALRERMHVVHEGVDTERVQRHEDASLVVEGKRLTRADTVITFVSRTLEPYRGFHVFMRALPRVLAALPDAHVLIVGTADRDGYGSRPTAAPTWRDLMLRELDGRLDLRRTHFTGSVDYETLMQMYSLSTAHVYLTYPFVLSWSLLEAMSCECHVVCSDTAPVRDLVRHGVNGTLVEFFDVEKLSETLIAACRNPADYAPLRAAAREEIVHKYDRNSICLPTWVKLIDRTLAV